MQAGEGALVTVDTKTICPICEDATHPERTTSDKKAGKGDLESKPGNLGCTSIDQLPSLPNYTTAAHHLIPAIQCLSKFHRLCQMCETVGYNVNNSNNGIPLPTCAQGDDNSYTSSGSKYGKLKPEHKTDVAFQIMMGTDKQWHVGHHNYKMPAPKSDPNTDRIKHPPNYDRLVKSQLRELEIQTHKEGKDICSPSDEKESGQEVISKLNNLSEIIKSGIVNWNLYFVSQKAHLFAQKYKGEI